MSPEHGARVSQIQRLIATPPVSLIRASRSARQIAPDAPRVQIPQRLSLRAVRVAQLALIGRCAAQESRPDAVAIDDHFQHERAFSKDAGVAVTRHSFRRKLQRRREFSDCSWRQPCRWPETGLPTRGSCVLSPPRLTALRVSDRVVGGSYHFFCFVAEASAGTAATLVALRPWHDA